MTVPSPEEDEPIPGNVASIEECRLWAELCMDDGVAFFHYNSVTEECHLYRTIDADCQSVGGPKAAPDFDQCTAKPLDITFNGPRIFLFYSAEQSPIANKKSFICNAVYLPPLSTLLSSLQILVLTLLVFCANTRDNDNTGYW